MRRTYPLIDLTHEITPFQPEQAGYWLWCCYPQFPAGTRACRRRRSGCRSGRARSSCCEARGQRFIAPDNGLLGLIAQSRSDARAYRLDPKALSALGLTFDQRYFSRTRHHGRRSAPSWPQDGCEPERLGERTELLLGRLRPAVRTRGRGARRAIAVMDHFGNVLTTIAAEASARISRACRSSSGGDVSAWCAPMPKPDPANASR